ncbi:hypothetical protein AAKU67_001331 [Oxalobacteraceae bacterium GrIS 2.11]
MDKSRKPFGIEEGKIQASLLLKALRPEVTAAVWHRALNRFLKLPEFSDCNKAEFPASIIKRKHALQVIALEQGFASWADLKCQLPFIRGGFLNQWFANYAVAKDYQREHGGFILPFKKQCSLCTAEYIANLGFDPNDTDWQLIGYDWVHPADAMARQRLHVKWISILAGRHE